ncbi:multiheme c-type cytochrome [Paludisphaera mucosa]|uniref:Multiheme c-type cytochrome n=1 Tax=Paludisphaera mucosa TaxID=3030827 RepID=A0ABT6FGN7_9BACT|nr:multiheme c-type cytochrome [Paludisphaera mucosa]MDG3006729.1 multiheme c-type cytochrome [Paludisphaera mucosa]
MARSSLRPLAVVATAAALLAYVGCTRPDAEKGADGTSSSPPPAAPAADAPTKSFKLFAQWPTPQGILVVSGEMDGYLEPCGCAAGQLGGLIRRFDFVRRMKAQGIPYALIDLGSLIKDPAGARGGFEQAKIKFGIAIKALGAFPYDALALSADDLKIGVGEAFAQFLNGLEGSTKLVAANVVPGAGFETLIVPHVLVQAGPVRLGVTSVLDPGTLAKLTDPDKDALLPTVKRPDDVLPGVLQDLEGRSDYQVLMIQGPPQEARRLATAYPGFDIVIATSEVADPEQDPQMLNGGKTMLVNVGRRGKYVGAIGFFEGAAPRYHQLGLTEKYNGPGSEVKKIIEDEYRGLLKAVGTVENFPRHDYVGGAPGATFIGAESCKQCHPNTFLKWSTTKHAQAFVSLEHDPKPDVTFDAECVTCHTVGFEYNSGWKSAAATPLLKGNQCENCHGPASKHVAAPDDLAFRTALKLTAEQADRNRLCIRCHDEDNSPKFVFETYWPQVIHSKLDTYTDPKVHQGVAAKPADAPTAAKGD